MIGSGTLARPYYDDDEEDSDSEEDIILIHPSHMKKGSSWVQKICISIWRGDSWVPTDWHLLAHLILQTSRHQISYEMLEAVISYIALFHIRMELVLILPLQDQGWSDQHWKHCFNCEHQCDRYPSSDIQFVWIAVCNHQLKVEVKNCQEEPSFYIDTWK